MFLEKEKKYCLAIDIGASSGRHIVGSEENGKMTVDEVFRFPNGVCEKDGRLTWDVDALFENVKRGIDAAIEKYPNIACLSIDTWGIDYVLLRGDDEVKPVYAYRDRETEKIVPKVHEIIDFPTLYERTGCQYQPFNSIYQLYRDKCCGRLDGVTDFLMMPEYLLWKLCKNKVKEYTNATTTGLINAESGDFDRVIIEKLGLPSEIFRTPEKPGKIIGEYKGIKCLLCATHDTASAVEGIPMENGENEPYISSGTWSLLGVKTAKPITDKSGIDGNWSNEGGVGYNRYQKNIMGMWPVNRLKDELCPELNFKEIEKLAAESRFDGIVDINAADFLSPDSMKEAFDRVLGKAPENIGDYFRCAYASLAVSYKTSVEELEKNTGRQFGKLYIVGGGAKNLFLNRLTESAVGKKVVALPIEATAIGNLKIQAEAEIRK